MKFKRINENVIRCVVSKEEMYDYGLEVSELVDNRDKAEDFLRRVMQEARYELNYKTNGGALSVQIALLPEGDIAMTIAEAMPEQLEAQMNRLKSYLEDFQKVLEGKVLDNLPQGKFKVELDGGHIVVAHVSGKMRMNNIRILPGDTVVLAMSPYDLTQGRIVYNKK